MNTASSAVIVATPDPMIDAVLVTYNRRETLFQNLERLETCPLFRSVIVVDNASTDGTLSAGQRRFPSIHWIASKRNDGCIAWNRGIESSAAPWILILDDDCFMDERSVAEALEYAQANPSVGLIAFNILSAQTGHSEWGSLARGIKSPTDWPNAIGACMLANTRAYRSIGGYKDFFLCFNDLELALNFWRNGYRVIFHPDWIASHLGLRPHPSQRRMHYEVRNLLWTLWGHLGIPFAFGVTFKFVIAALMDSRGWSQSLEIVLSAREGIRRGWLMRKSTRGNAPRRVRRGLARNLFLSGRSEALLKRLNVKSKGNSTEN